MSITGIILAAVIVGGTGLFIGIFLGLAGKKFAVEVDEKEEQILGVLAGKQLRRMRIRRMFRSCSSHRKRRSSGRRLPGRRCSCSSQRSASIMGEDAGEADP